MGDRQVQDFSNHARLVPLYHYVLSLLVLVNLLWAGWGVFQGADLGAVVNLLLAISILLIFYYLRAFPLAVQDRLIRLEERLRLREVLPPELHDRIHEIRPGQLIALRFAADAELTGLVQRVLDGELVSRQSIKKQIGDWRADDYRC